MNTKIRTKQQKKEKKKKKQKKKTKKKKKKKKTPIDLFLNMSLIHKIIQLLKFASKRKKRLT